MNRTLYAYTRSVTMGACPGLLFQMTIAQENVGFSRFLISGPKNRVTMAL
jgi:hypothetical protein